MTARLSRFHIVYTQVKFCEDVSSTSITMGHTVSNISIRFILFMPAAPFVIFFFLQ